jgi:hypothetical protein
VVLKALRSRFGLSSLPAGVAEACDETVCPGNRVKVYLTDDQILRLLCIGGRCNLVTVRSAQPTEYAVMNVINLTARFAQVVLAVGVTAISVMAFQFALLAG